MADPASSPKPRQPLSPSQSEHSLPRSMAAAHNGTLSHRSSFAENIRNAPPSPRQRHASFTQAAVQELINNPTGSKSADARFAGRDWRQIQVRELLDKDDVRFVSPDTSVEEATKILVESGPPNVVLIRAESSGPEAYETFDYTDLNAYLLVVLGLANPSTEQQIHSYTSIAEKARVGSEISLDSIRTLSHKPALILLEESQDLSKAAEIFAGGVHWLLIVKDGTTDVVGILSQWKLVKFLWDNGRSFPILDHLYTSILKDLNIGSVQIIAINGDKPLTDALQLMHNEGLTSVAVVDNGQNVIGNISTVDVRHLTNTSSLPLLQSSCIHFISVILSERGVESGKDSFPVFHVNPYATLAHTVAKLVATRSHRMWVVESASPSHSSPPTPAALPAATPALFSSTNAGPTSPGLSSSFPAVSASALPGAGISGRLTGVVSLTDVLNLFARQSGLHPLDPNEHRSRRRRSSSISVRPSIDSMRSSSVDIRR